MEEESTDVVYPPPSLEPIIEAKAEEEDKEENALPELFFKQLLQIPINQICVDCNEGESEWGSYYYGVFVCAACAQIHLQIHDDCRPLNHHSWIPFFLLRFNFGGNLQFNNLINTFDIQDYSIPDKYRSNAVYYHRRKLDSFERGYIYRSQAPGIIHGQRIMEQLTPEDVTSSTIKQFATDAFEVGKEAALIAKEKLDNFGVTSKVKTAGEFIVNRTNSAANKIGNISHEIRGNETIQGMGEGAVDTITGAAKKMKNWVTGWWNEPDHTKFEETKVNYPIYPPDATQMDI